MKKEVKILTSDEMSERRKKMNDLPFSDSELKFYKRELIELAYVCDCTRQEMMSLCSILLSDSPPTATQVRVAGQNVKTIEIDGVEHIVEDVVRDVKKDEPKEEVKEEVKATPKPKAKAKAKAKPKTKK